MRIPSCVVHHAAKQNTPQLHLYREALPGKGVAPNGTAGALIAYNRETDHLF